VASVSFLDNFEKKDRDTLVEICEVQTLELGDYLLRRGEKGGDLYLVERGTIAVVDTRSSPEGILLVEGAGALLGEIGFLDGTVRTADLKCTASAEVRVWRKQILDSTLSADLNLEKSFYRALAQVTSHRLRGMLNMNTAEARTRQGEGIAAQREAQEVASAVLGVWMEIEARLLKESNDEEARSMIIRSFEKMQDRARHWLGGIEDAEERFDAGETLCRILQPFLQQAHLCKYAFESVEVDAGRRVPRAHIILGEAKGHRRLGEILDQVLLALPTCQSIGWCTRVLTAQVADEVPSDRSTRLAVLGVGSGALIADLGIRLGRYGATIHVVDGDPKVLDSVDMGMTARPKDIYLDLVPVDIGLLALGRRRLPFGELDVVVINGLADHLPDRLLAGLLTRVRGHLREGGLLLLTSLTPSRDAVVFDHLLRWPMIRRSPRQILGLMEAAGYRAESTGADEEEADCALVLKARPA
jgi:CRP-like cAMP-binding protein